MTKYRFCIALLLGSLFTSFMANRVGAESNPDNPAQPASVSETSNDTLAAQTQDSITQPSTALALGSVARMLGALLIVIVLLYGAVYLLKKGMGRRIGKGSATSLLAVLETTYLGPKHSISLVRVGTRAVVVGVTERGMSALTEVTETELKSLAVEENLNPQPGFSQVFKLATDKLKDFSSRRTAAATTNQ